MAKISIKHGDCLEVLRGMEAGSVDALVTDPPAGISFMGKEWDSHKGGRDHWIAWLTDVMRECLRVMKPGAHGLVWAIPRTSHWTATALENAGFEVRDVITHHFGSGFPKSLDISKAIDKAAGAEREVVGVKSFPREGTTPVTRKATTIMSSGSGENVGQDSNFITAPATAAAKQWQGWGTALKPASEHWILVRKPCSEKTVAANVLKHGTGGLNIDASRISGKYQNQGGGSFATGKFANSNRSNTEKDGLKYIEGQDTQGRFPANLVFSHSLFCTDEACEDGCPVKELDGQSGVTKGGGKTIVKTNTEQMFGMKGHVNVDYPDFGGASRFFYCAKASKRERNAGLADGQTNGHPTIKSQKLMEYLIKLITPPQGVVLDPFMGSGSTGVACKTLGTQFIGIERETEYVEIARARIG